jgi:uroporphyrinogen-III synthase
MSKSDSDSQKSRRSGDTANNSRRSGDTANNSRRSGDTAHKLAIEDLQKTTIVLARSKAPSQELLAALSKLDLKAEHLPLLQTRTLARSSALSDSMTKAERSDSLIFVSRAAVLAAIQLAPKLLQTAKHLAAVGKSTADLLSEFSHRVIIRPLKDEGALALLAHPAFASVSGLHISIFCAADGLNQLQSELQARGAIVENIICYERFQSELGAKELELCANSPLLYVGSEGFLRAFAALMAHNQKAHVFAPSTRVAQTATRLGFANSNCLGAGDAELLRTLCTSRHLW